MATKTFTTDFSLNQQQVSGLENAIKVASVVHSNETVEVKYYGKENANALHNKFDSIFG